MVGLQNLGIFGTFPLTIATTILTVALPSLAQQQSQNIPLGVLEVSGGQAAASIDRSSVLVEADGFRTYILDFEYENPRRIDIGEMKYLLTSYAGNCNNNTTLLLFSAALNSNGQQLGEIQEFLDERWEPAPPGTISRAALDIACGRR